MAKYELNYEGYEQYLFDAHLSSGFIERMNYKFKFDNGWCAFVSTTNETRFRALWSLVPFKHDGERFKLCYDNPICTEAEIYLTDEDVRTLLEQFKEL